MEGVIHSEVYVFLTTLYGGIIIGFIYDIYRIFRYFFKPKRVATFIEDLVFWIIVSVLSLLIIIFSNWGELRGYVFLGFILGALLYNRLLSKIVITILVKVITILWRGIKFILNIVFYPFKLLEGVLIEPYRKSRRKMQRGYSRLKRKSKLPFRIFKDFKKQTKNILFKK
ncbi:spore cortex biosynthesis protein YabQ [Sporosalibacterium faouarense]|uniref:spore cortex biosynthesis protein YabQ n=1 Tax=Sporosalibacterium faouarense TaxID=516123 RepID=UPI00192AE08E|nr:spore cortex biosynthesis protein YabQ [Sporosalibacterium faouarense]